MDNFAGVLSEKQGRQAGELGDAQQRGDGTRGTGTISALEVEKLGRLCNGSLGVAVLGEGISREAETEREREVVRGPEHHTERRFNTLASIRKGKRKSKRF